MAPWYIHSIRRIYDPHCSAQVDGTKYAFAVAEPYTAGRLMAAWWVLTGKAHAFAWPKPGDLEAAVGLPLWDRSAIKPTGVQAGTPKASQLRAALTYGRDCVMESFDHVKDTDDQVMADARLRAIDVALETIA